jgi:TRAP-type C4-dicarboxylate transport system substrate-binding protein
MIRKFVVTLCLTLFLGAPAFAKTFKIATVAPNGTSWMKELKAGSAEIKQKTNGRVKFRFYPGGIMGNDKSVLRKIRVGQLHGGAITGGGLMEISPDSQVYSLPLAFKSHQEVDYARTKMDKLIIDGLYNKGFVSFGLGEGGFAYLMSNQPLSSINDLKGHKIWIPEGDNFSRTAFESLGVSPIPLPLTDVLTGLQTGLIDTIASSAMGAIALQWHTKVKYITNTPLMYLYGTLILQRKAFEKIKKEDQAVVRNVMQKVFKKLDIINRQDNLDAMLALQSQGISIIDPPSHDKQQWQTSVTGAIDNLTSNGSISKPITQTLYNHLSDFRNASR